jgi:murein L,D-transpeptidase YafK
MLTRILILMSMVASLFSADIVDIYRKKGSGAAMAEIEKSLMSREYWKGYLANVDTSLGFYETDKFIIICDKSKPEVTLYRYDGVKLVQDSKIKAIVGGGKGDKLSAGDLKTPTGSYDFVNKIKGPTNFYGPFSFVTDYPNLYDIVNKKTGKGIWLHGEPTDTNRTNSSKGCVVVNNTYLCDLEKKLDFKKTVLIIDDNALAKTSKDEIAIMVSSMFQWRRAWATNDLKGYMDFYADDFRRFDGMNKKAYSEYKKRIFTKNEAKSIVFRDFEVTPNPTSTGDKIFKVKFYEDYSAPSFKYKGYKDLFARIKDGKMQIVAER